MPFFSGSCQRKSPQKSFAFASRGTVRLWMRCHVKSTAHCFCNRFCGRFARYLNVLHQHKTAAYYDRTMVFWRAIWRCASPTAAPGVTDLFFLCPVLPPLYSVSFFLLLVQHTGALHLDLQFTLVPKCGMHSQSVCLRF